MTALHISVGIAVIALNLAAGLLGSWAWWRAVPSTVFWPLLRAGQAVVVIQAALGGVLLAVGRQPSDLHVLYGLLPVGVAFFAEQLRLVSADAVLSARGLESAQEVGGLPKERQHEVVLAIVRRETGVMALSALVIVFLALRAAGVTPAL
jgi:hypothetical protein